MIDLPHFLLYDWYYFLQISIFNVSILCVLAVLLLLSSQYFYYNCIESVKDPRVDYSWIASYSESSLLLVRMWVFDSIHATFEEQACREACDIGEDVKSP